MGMRVYNSKTNKVEVIEQKDLDKKIHFHFLTKKPFGKIEKTNENGENQEVPKDEEKAKK